jgi:carboxymethylenebutenolidase
VTVVELDGPHGPLPAELVRPDGPGPWPGVVVVHDFLGMTRDLRAQLDWLAGAGFLALAPDLFAWGRRVRCVRAAFRQLAAREGRAFDEIDAARAHVVARPESTGRVGVVGFCLGGGFALLAAPRGGFDAASVNYGDVPDDAATVLRGACPIVGSFGGRDRMLRGAAAQLDAALDEAEVEHDVKEYAGCGHAFMNDHRWFMATVGRITGARHDEAAAADARRRIVGFFDHHLRPAAARAEEASPR